MLKITKATDAIEVKNITMCLYSVPGIGKTSAAFTADHPLLLDFDKGSYRSGNRRDTVQIESWEDVTAITADDLKPYRTVIVDTAGRALDCLTAYIIRGNPKMGRGGALTLQGYGELKSVFVAWTKLIRSFGLDVVLLSHSDEQRSGDEINERLDIQGGSKNEVYKAADCMGRLYLRNGKRVLNFSPSDTAFGKNPAQLQPIDVPDYTTSPDFLAGVIKQIKDSLNKFSGEQTEVANALDAWRIRITNAITPEDFDQLRDEAKQADERVKANISRLMGKAAKTRGITFDKAAGVFVEAGAAA